MQRSITTLAAITLLFGTSLAYAADEKDGRIALTSEEIQWKAHFDNLPEVKMAYLEGDPAKAGPFTIRAKMPAYYQVGPTTLTHKKTITVLWGTLYFDFGDKMDKRKARKFSAGSFILIPANTPYYRFTRERGAILQVHGEGPHTFHFINDGTKTGPYKEKN